VGRKLVAMVVVGEASSWAGSGDYGIMGMTTTAIGWSDRQADRIYRRDDRGAHAETQFDRRFQ